MLESGDDWPYHYRGTRYHYNKDGKTWWESSKDGVKVYVEAGHESILKHLLDLKQEGGIFRITETGDVITKIEDKEIWKPVYVCEMDEQFLMDQKVNITPQNLSTGDLWPGFYDGARYSYLNDIVWWNNPDGPRQQIEGKFPDVLMKSLNRLKPEGGSFRITENGYVITLIPSQPLPNNLKEQLESFTKVQQRLVSIKVETTEMLPVYIGKFHEGITLKEPVDLTSPLSKEEKKKILDFLETFSQSKRIDIPSDSFDKIQHRTYDDPEDENVNSA